MLLEGSGVGPERPSLGLEPAGPLDDGTARAGRLGRQVDRLFQSGRPAAHGAAQRLSLRDGQQARPDEMGSHRPGPRTDDRCRAAVSRPAVRLSRHARFSVSPPFQGRSGAEGRLLGRQGDDRSDDGRRAQSAHRRSRLSLPADCRAARSPDRDPAGASRRQQLRRRPGRVGSAGRRKKRGPARRGDGLRLD